MSSSRATPSGRRRRPAKRTRYVLAGAVVLSLLAGVAKVSADALDGDGPNASSPATSPVASPTAPKATAAAGPAIRLSASTPVLYGSLHASPVKATVTVTNAGSTSLAVTSATLSGSAELRLSAVSGFTLAAGQSRGLTVTLDPGVLGPQRATLQVASNDPATPRAQLSLGGLVINNTSTSEPSLQWIIHAYGVAAADGDAQPSTYSLDATRMPPSAGVLVTSFTRQNASLPVTVTAMSTFVSPSTAGQAALNPTWGWMTPKSSNLTTVASYSIRRGFIGSTRQFSPAGTFALWARAEGTMMRTDQNSASKPRFIAFPVTGATGTYVVAVDTTGRLTDDWNDLTLLVRNVKLS